MSRTLDSESIAHWSKIQSKIASETRALMPATNETMLNRPISPPASNRQKLSDSSDGLDTKHHKQSERGDSKFCALNGVSNSPANISSPIQLTRVEGLSYADNVDTVSLQDIVGDPLIKECWVFNYLFDVDFLISKFDEDVRDTILVKIVHGSWRKEDSNRIHIEDATQRYKNVQAITAYMPEMFGTHHSKMIILLRHDEQAQIIIFTANIVAGDWRMCQAVWRSLLLPLLSEASNIDEAASSLPSIGSGARFKSDLLAYLRAYGKARLESLTKQLREYDFSTIRAALIASTPGLRNILRCIPLSSLEQPRVTIQVSSVASLGITDKWLESTFFKTLATTVEPKKDIKSKPKFSLVFPTAHDIRRSVDGYDSGGSIHMKIQSAAQAKQLKYLKPMLCHWADKSDSHEVAASSSSSSVEIREAGRRRAAPHIKTYMRFSDNSMTKIDWAIMTSANLSTQAWGAATNGAGEVRICSYEIGVVVWPALWDDNIKGSVEMVPTFKKDLPSVDEVDTGAGGSSMPKVRVGLRMPFDLPLVPYTDDDSPWCATVPDNKPDWMGRVWPGFGSR